MRKEQKVLREKEIERIRKALNPNNNPRIELIPDEGSKQVLIRVSPSSASEFKVDIRIALYSNKDLSIGIKPTKLGQIQKLRPAPDGSLLFRASPLEGLPTPPNPVLGMQYRASP